MFSEPFFRAKDSKIQSYSNLSSLYGEYAGRC